MHGSPEVVYSFQDAVHAAVTRASDLLESSHYIDNVHLVDVVSPVEAATLVLRAAASAVHNIYPYEPMVAAFNLSQPSTYSPKLAPIDYDCHGFVSLMDCLVTRGLNTSFTMATLF